MTSMSPPGRRHALLMATALLASQAARPSHAAPPLTPTAEPGFPGGATLLIAGPPAGRLDRWADLLVPALDRMLPGAAAHPLVRSSVGGADGVTGANLFQTRVSPDGDTALMLPGSAAMAWLVGDPRARFDAARWVPAWAGMASAVLVSRVALAPGRTLRVGGVKPGSVGLPALLALDLIGIQVTQAPDADADAVFHVGQGARVTAAGHPDMTPVMTLGSIDAAGIWLRDPAFPAVPSAIELTAHQTPSRLSAALRATSAATLLDAAVVLPSLSPANRVALWRRACADAWATADLVHEAAALGIRPAAPPATVSLMGAVAADVPTLLALRTWLESRWAWRAG